MQEKPDYISVLVVSAHSLVREGIISMLTGGDKVKVVGQASNKLELMECVYKLNPDIAIVKDEDTKSISSLEAIRLINQKATNTKVLLLIEDYNEDKELAALKMGVEGCLPERARKDDLIRCIRGVNRGEIWVRRKVTEKLIRQLLALIPQREDYLYQFTPSFSKREVEVMVLVIKGYRNKEIAKRLFISEKTVKHYLSKIFKKLNIKKRVNVRQYFLEKVV